jgi:hypothetical protein
MLTLCGYQLFYALSALKWVSILILLMQLVFEQIFCLLPSVWNSVFIKKKKKKITLIKIVKLMCYGTEMIKKCVEFYFWWILFDL